MMVFYNRFILNKDLIDHYIDIFSVCFLHTKHIDHTRFQVMVLIKKMFHYQKGIILILYLSFLNQFFLINKLKLSLKAINTMNNYIRHSFKLNVLVEYLDIYNVTFKCCFKTFIIFIASTGLLNT